MKLKNPKHELFCQLYAGKSEHFGNATEAYLAAYRKDPKNEKDRATARSEGSRLLIKPNIQKRCTEVLNELLKDDVVDGELAYIISQRQELAPKISAIKEYNALRQRVKTKVEIGFSEEVRKAIEKINTILP